MGSPPMMGPPPGSLNFRTSGNKRRMLKRKDSSEPEPPVDGGTALPFVYSSKDWLGKTPKSYVMEYFQRSNLQPPKWIRESHSTRQLHLIKVTFQDPTGKEVTLYADRYFRSVKDAEHNTSILVLCHLMPGVKEPKDIIDRMTQLQNLSKLQKRRRQEVKPLRMGAYSFKNKMYSRTGPASLYAATTTGSTPRGNKGPNKQYENYGYGYDYSAMYDASAYAQDYSNLYNAYYQAGYGFDYSNYGTGGGKTAESQTTQPINYNTNQRAYDSSTSQIANYPSQLQETTASAGSRESFDRSNTVDNRANTNQQYLHYAGQSWSYPSDGNNTSNTTRSSFPGYNPSVSYNSQNQYSQAGYSSF
jgi:hypothetical protein